jgi:SAM-dependent methyltransferase
MDPDTLRKRLAEFDYWYHKIELAPGIVTPGFELDDLWNHLRRVRDRVDYKDKSVLDISSFDGMFVFEAERLGAQNVIATDCQYKSFNNFLFCREVLGSKALPFYNVSPYNLVDRLDVVLDENYETGKPDARKFDIVQHFGLLYHLRDPMMSLAQARSVLKPGGTLIVETDAVIGEQDSFLLSNGLPKNVRVRDNYSVWWEPTKRCLIEMLEASMFTVDEASYSEFVYEVPAAETGRMTNVAGAPADFARADWKIGRAAVVAHAIEPGGTNEKFEREIIRSYRNPGFAVHRLGWNK